jgi:Fatty acid synthesis protein
MTIRVAVDLASGGRPSALLAGARRAAAVDPLVVPVLVGPPEVLGELDTVGLQTVSAPGVLRVDLAAAPAVRAAGRSSLRVATGLLRDAAVDAVVTAAPVALAAAAAEFALGPLPGAGPVGLAVTLCTPTGPVVVLDCVGRPAADSRRTSLARAGDVLARLLHDRGSPRVADLRPADIAGLLAGEVDGVVGAGSEAAVLVATVDALVAGAQAPSVRRGPGLLVGVEGLVGVVPDGGDADAVASCVASVVRGVRAGLLAELSTVLGAEVRHRREAAGLPAALPG